MKLKRKTGRYEATARLRLPLSAYLCYLLVATLLFTGVSFSRYAAGSSMSSNVQVAKFSVSSAKASGFTTSKTIDLTSATTSQSVSWQFTVTSNSQVASTDTVTVTLPKALPGGVTMSMKVNNSTVTPTITNSQKTYTFKKDFAMGNVTHTWVLTFTGNPSSKDLPSSEETWTGIKIHADVIQKN